MALAVVLTGPLAKQVGDIVGLGSTAVTVWDIAKWPVLILIVSFLFAFLYWAAPERPPPEVPLGQPRRSPSRCVLWIVASAAFAFYVANFASYNKTYGALGGRDHLPRLALDHQPRDSARRRVQRRAPARPPDPGRPPGRKEPFLPARDPART